MDTDLTPAALTALRKILDLAEMETRRMAAATGLTPSQAMVLRHVATHSAVTPGAVAVALGFGQATVTNIVDRLVASGYVERNRSEADKRQVLLTATTPGRDKLDGAPFPLQLRFTQGFASLETWEQAMMLSGLERLGNLLVAPPTGPERLTEHARK